MVASPGSCVPLGRHRTDAVDAPNWARRNLSSGIRRRQVAGPADHLVELALLLDLTSRRVSTSSPVGWPSPSSSQWRPG